MPFDYNAQRNQLDLGGRNVVDCIERIGHLLKSTGVFRVGSVIHGNSWDCLLAIRLLEHQGFIELADGTGMTQDHIFRKAT